MTKKETEQKALTLKEATDEQLKATAFDLTQQLQVLQGQYQTILQELQSRQPKEEN